ncbi:MAG TPA: TadE/TadG family type IV pilus assembly protein [Gaiellaceae bacterium]|nr:TadE/TadG family type IV pilus assembly protein [Gaiellaceae bacterium]
MKKRIQIRSQQGQTMTEFALVLPVLALILFAVIQFGIVFNNYITLTDATRAGARKAAVSRQDPNRNSAVMSAVRSSASDLTSSKLSVSPPSSTWNPGDDVTVTASYPYSISLLGIVVKSGQLSSTTTERVE